MSQPVLSHLYLPMPMVVNAPRTQIVHLTSALTIYVFPLAQFILPLEVTEMDASAQPTKNAEQTYALVMSAPHLVPQIQTKLQEATMISALVLLALNVRQTHATMELVLQTVLLKDKSTGLMKRIALAHHQTSAILQTVLIISALLRLSLGGDTSL